jgi:hypothetical protein
MRAPPDAADAIELAGLLEFIDGWLRSDRGNLAAAPTRFAGCGLP